MDAVKFITAVSIMVCLFCECSSSRGLNHAFSTVISAVESNYAMDLKEGVDRTYRGRSFLDCDRVEMKKCIPMPIFRERYKEFEEIMIDFIDELAEGESKIEH